MDARNECANCGDTEDLLRCSRCRNEWFCSRQCQKAYWPFHRNSCKANEFADCVEATQADSKFAQWMRQHGKQAVLKDDDVERLERASRASSASLGRAEVLESMYGRLNPQPTPPSYNSEERLAMRVKEEAEQKQVRLSRQDQAWMALSIPEGLGVECARYKWRQNQSHVEVYCLVPHGIESRKVKVVLGSDQLSVSVGDQGFHGELHKSIVPTHSVWFIADGILHIQMMKLNRKGHYQPGTTNADTWWRSLMARAGPLEAIQGLKNPPTRYYWMAYED